MTTDRSFALARAPIDRRFYRVLGLSALVVGGVTTGLLAVARHRDPALTTAPDEQRLATLRSFIQRQEERTEGGTGTRHEGTEGRLGSRASALRGARYAIRNNAPAPHLSRNAAREQVQNRGVFASLHAPAAGVVSPFGGVTESGVDNSNAVGNMTGDAVGDAFGYGGLGATGTGVGGGGTIGMGAMGTVGHGAGTGSGQGYGSGAGRAPSGRGFAAPVTERPVVVIDPNGRFATTYRPGHGHTAWFDASVARGEIPASTRDLLAELGGHDEPAMAAPADHALDFRVDLERSALSPSGGPVRMRLALRSSAATVTRPTMSVHLVMDISGSMGGDPIAHAREAARALVERLADDDHFSLTVFASDARAAVSEGTVGHRRAEILHVIDGIEVEGGTNISAGLALGYRMAAHGPSVTSANRLVLLLSDGEPTDGIVERDALANMAAVALQEGGTETTSVGVGTRYDGALMSAIADRGAGGYYYVPDSAHIADALRTELDNRAQPVAQALELRVRLADGMQLTEAYGSRRLSVAETADVRAQEVTLDARTAVRDHIARDRAHDRAGGMRFFIPGFARDDRHVMLFGLQAPAGTGEREVATLEIRYKDRITGRNVTVERPVRVGYAASDAASAATLDGSVARTVQSFDAGRTLAEAAAAAGDGDNARAAALLTERVAILRAAAERLSAPTLTQDAARLSRVASLLGGGTTTPVGLAMLLGTSAQAMLR